MKLTIEDLNLYSEGRFVFGLWLIFCVGRVFPLTFFSSPHGVQRLQIKSFNMSQTIDFQMPVSTAPLQETSVMLRGSLRHDLHQSQSSPAQQQQKQQQQDHRSLQDLVVPTPAHKIPIYLLKDAAERPFDPETFFKGTDTFQERPTNISYFPDQLIQMSFVISVMTPLQSTTTISKRQDDTTNNENNILTDSPYLEDLKEALDLLATELAPKAYPDLWVRELTTSVESGSTTGTSILYSGGGGGGVGNDSVIVLITPLPDKSFELCFSLSCRIQLAKLSKCYLLDWDLS
jgi:hypothetical protein